MKKILLALLFIPFFSSAQNVVKERFYNHTLTSVDVHNGEFAWKMKRADEIEGRADYVSTSKIDTRDWMPAVVPGTVLNSLVYNKVYPEPYYGLNNKLESGLIPDLYHVGREFYTYWFRTEFALDKNIFDKKKIWLQVDGINYRAEIWLNGSMVGNISGMFQQSKIDITEKVTFSADNILAVKVYPIDVPGTIKPKGGKSFGATGEFQNGGNGEIGANVTQLMTVGWDFTYLDGIRDRNTGIWRDISIFATGRATLAHPFVKSDLAKPEYNVSRQTISVEVAFPNYLQQNRRQKVKVLGEIKGEDIRFEKEISMFRNEVQNVVFTPEEFPQLIIKNPCLWWPINKGKQKLYDLELRVEIDGQVTDAINTRFGIREITSTTDTPDKSRTFYINGKPLFIKGTNWLPENMLRTSNERTYAELRYTAQSGVNLIRFWGGGITESDYFFQLCDELGILVWQEFWMTGDTKHPTDLGLYLSNVASTVKRIRNHPSLAYYVSSNESSEMPQTKELIMRLDGTRGYQMESESEGIHDGSPYKQVNIMSHYEDKASPRGSRVYGFNPEYGSPCLPTVECLREMMDEKDLWPINKEVWDYSDGNGFHLMSTLYTDMTNEYGLSKSISEFAQKAQFLGALNYKSIWEVWNYNKLHYGDRYTSGFLFWYHNSPIRQVAGRMWDWSLEPTAALYAAQNACEPLHPQFDYLKNTVSVINDYYQAFTNYKVTAEVYDLNMKKVFFKEAKIDLPENGVANDIFKVDFSKVRTSVQFLKLKLFDEKNKEVGSNFYWRSNNKYKGANTLTGPATAGFQDIRKLAKTTLEVNYKTSVRNNKHFIELNLQNVGRSLSFFTQIQWLDKNGKPVRPSFYTDNFMCLMPEERRQITIETDLSKLTDNEYSLVVGSYNGDKQVFNIQINRKEGITKSASLPEWALGEFKRPNITHPVISPITETTFHCPMRKELVNWEESDTFNPAAIAKDGKIVVLYRAEDNSGQGIGKRTSRIGYAESTDGITMNRRKTPVFFPDEDACKELDWAGGCEDPRIAVTEDGLYVMLYTSWNRKVARLSVATSRDLITWEKHGAAFGKAYNGRFADLFCKSGSLLTTIKNGKIVIQKHNGKYFMYWGERAIHAATSDNLIDWEPVLDDQSNLLALARPRPGHFDSNLTECGPPALLTDKGIVLIYNGRNAPHSSKGDKNYPERAYCAGQMLFDARDPYKLLDRLDTPFFYPEASFEKSGQYKDGTVFVEGLAFLNNKFYLYYGCADSHTGVAICDYAQ